MLKLFGGSLKKSTTNVKFLALALLLILVAAILTLFSHNKNEAPKKTLGNSKTACDLLVTPSARYVLSPKAEKVGGTNKGDTNTSTTSTKDMKTTTCTYKDPASVANRQTATLIMRSPYTKEGIASNKKSFSSKKDTLKKQYLNLYKLPSYWDYSKGRLEILKNNTWYSVIVGDDNPNKRDLSQAEDLSDLLVTKF